MAGRSPTLGNARAGVVGAAAKYALTHTSCSGWPSTYSYYPITGSTDAAVSVAIAKFWWTAPSRTALAFSGSWCDGVSAAAAFNVFGPVLRTTRQHRCGHRGRAEHGGRPDQRGQGCFDHRPYHDGVIPAGTQASTCALRTNDGRAATVERSGPIGAEPNLDSLRTVHRQ